MHKLSKDLYIEYHKVFIYILLINTIGNIQKGKFKTIGNIQNNNKCEVEDWPLGGFFYSFIQFFPAFIDYVKFLCISSSSRRQESKK